MPDKKIRQGDRKCDLRRDKERQNVSFEVLFDSQDGKTINVSASGIYFEVPTTDIEAFSSGTEIPIQINTVTSAPSNYIIRLLYVFGKSKLWKLELRGTMLSTEKCKEHLSDTYTDEEIEVTRNTLYQVAELLVDKFIEDKNHIGKKVIEN